MNLTYQSQCPYRKFLSSSCFSGSLQRNHSNTVVAEKSFSYTSIIFTETAVCPYVFAYSVQCKQVRNYQQSAEQSLHKKCLVKNPDMKFLLTIAILLRVQISPCVFICKFINWGGTISSGLLLIIFQRYFLGNYFVFPCKWITATKKKKVLFCSIVFFWLLTNKKGKKSFKVQRIPSSELECILCHCMQYAQQRNLHRGVHQVWKCCVLPVAYSKFIRELISFQKQIPKKFWQMTPIKLEPSQSEFNGVRRTHAGEAS